MAEGRGRYLPSKEAAIAEVQALKAKGITNIDVGCMQVNLYYHGSNFDDLNEAFDPVQRHPVRGDVLAAQPYRFAGTVELDVRYPTDRRMLLPPSTAPAIRALRGAAAGTGIRARI